MVFMIVCLQIIFFPPCKASGKDIVTNGKVLYTDATIKILQYINKLVKMTLKGRLENLDSEFFADGFLFGKILLMGRARTQA